MRLDGGPAKIRRGAMSGRTRRRLEANVCKPGAMSDIEMRRTCARGPRLPPSPPNASSTCAMLDALGAHLTPGPSSRAPTTLPQLAFGSLWEEDKRAFSSLQAILQGLKVESASTWRGLACNLHSA